MLITFLAILATLAVIALLSHPALRRSDLLRATVTPLASIIGSGFLICGPLLAREFGLAASAAMALLLVIAYGVGWIIRFNIRHAEPYLAAAASSDFIVWLARLGQAALAIAYSISVAYYLKLLAEFTLKHVVVAHTLIANGLITALIGALLFAAFSGGLRRVEHIAHSTVVVKLGVIAGLLVALAMYWLRHSGLPIPIQSPRLSIHSATLLLGLLITVQGFETSRYLGEAYSPDLRIRSMRYAQWLSSAIYLLFIVLLTPFLAPAARTPGVAGILDIMQLVAPLLGALVLVGAVASQLSAAVADSIGASGLLSEVFRRWLDTRKAFVVIGALATGVVWLTDPFEVVALASRAFAVYYAFQCATAFLISLRTQRGGTWLRMGMATVGLVCLMAAGAGSAAG